MAFKYKFKSALWKTEIQSYVQLVSDTLSIADVYCLSYCQAEEQRFIEQIFLSNLEKRRFITQRNIFLHSHILQPTGYMSIFICSQFWNPDVQVQN